MKIKIAYLGAGAWGFCLARLLAEKGYDVTSWSNIPSQIEQLSTTREHPYLPGRPISQSVVFTTDLALALEGATIIVESVTSAGIRPVFEQIRSIGIPVTTPIVMTSKGIEQKSGLILSDVVTSILGEDHRQSIATLSGPSFAEEVSQHLPTSVVCGAYSEEVAQLVSDLFTTSYLRVYPNSDIRGVAFGGALKNIIAIACGISDGLSLGTGAKATLMTRGLHEIAKLARLQGCRPETLYGLSGMGDLFLTCSSSTSRNYRFGKLLSEGHSAEEAKKIVQMVVEGAYTCVSALELSREAKIAMPISEAVMKIIEGSITPKEATHLLMQRSIKEETL